MVLVCFRDGKAITITHKGGKGHEEKVSDLVDNKLLDERDQVVTRVPAIARHEMEGRESSFIVLASTQLAKPQQVVDTVSAAILKAANSGNEESAATAAVQALEKAAAEHGAKSVTAIVALLNWD